MTLRNLPHKLNMVYKFILASGVLFVALLLFANKSYAYTSYYLTTSYTYPTGTITNTDCFSSVSGTLRLEFTSADTVVLYALTNNGKIEIDSFTSSGASLNTYNIGVDKPIFITGLVYDLVLESSNNTNFYVMSQNITINVSDNFVSKLVDAGSYSVCMLSNPLHFPSVGLDLEAFEPFQYSYDSRGANAWWVGISDSPNTDLYSVFASSTGQYLLYVGILTDTPGNILSTSTLRTYHNGTLYKSFTNFEEITTNYNGKYLHVISLKFDDDSEDFLQFNFQVAFSTLQKRYITYVSLLGYEGTAADIIEHMENEWNNTQSAVNSMNNKITDVNNTQSSVTSTESSAMSTYDTYYSNAGIDTFSIAGIGSELVLFSTIANAIYDKFPVKLRLVFIGSLVFGLFALVLSATGRIIKKEDFNVRRTKK